jgi:hypothetical protein
VKRIAIKRIERLIDYHQQAEEKLVSRTSLELGEVHSDLLIRVGIILGLSKTAVIRLLLDNWVQDQPGGWMVANDPSRLMEAVNNGDL